MREHHFRLYLILHNRFPGEKAASFFAAKTAEAFCAAGIKTTVIVPRRLGRSTMNPYTYYGTKKGYDVVYLPTIDLFQVPLVRALAFYISFAVFSFFTLWYLIRHATKEDKIYSNETLPLLLASFFFPQTFYEAHIFPERKRLFYSYLFRRVRGIISINRWKAEHLSKQYHISSERILVAHSAVDLSLFDLSLSKQDARKRLNLPNEKKLIIYTGHLFGWKGVDVLASAAKMLSSDTLVVFVGGTPADVNSFRQNYGRDSRIKIVGHRPPTEIPVWQQAADVLVLPNTAKENISKYYTSPMKLFEYMASGVPIVASRLPSIIEVLNNENGVLVEPDDADALATGIKTLISDGKRGEHLAAQARKDVERYSYTSRARRVVAFIS